VDKSNVTKSSKPSKKPKKQEDAELSEREIKKRFDDTLAQLLKTPPKHKKDKK
jgi:hypothetical protein